MDLRALRPVEPAVARDADLRRWRSQFPDITPIADVQPRRRATVIGVIEAVRLFPGKALEVTVSDGSGELIAAWTGRTNIPGLELGGGLRLEGTVAFEGDGDRRMRNPSWVPITEPYS
ncbi:MAG: hypothetical protein ACR2KP_08115 [Egibacteraceae bacterium]